MQFKTLLKDEYGGDQEAYTRNYSHRTGKRANRDPKVVLNYVDELKGKSSLQVAPHSRQFIQPEALLASKTPNPYDQDRLSLAPASGTDGPSRNNPLNVKESNSSNALM